MSDVEKLLTDKGIHHIRKGKDVLVVCLNPEHDDSNPSMRIDVEEGKFHCLSCGYKGNIFSFFNRHRNVFNSKVKKLRDRLVDIRKASWAGFELPHDAFFVSRDFQGIPVDILQKFKAFTTSEYGMEDRIVFPIFDSNNRIVAFQGRYTHTDISPKYLVYPKETSLPWYPNQFETNVNNGIILVEGLRDMLFLRSKGFDNAVAVFGTKSINYDNIVEHLTPYMLKGLDTVYILMDGDSAGKSAANHIENCITRKTDLITKILELPEGVDPATMDEQQLKTLRSVKTYESSGSTEMS